MTTLRHQIAAHLGTVTGATTADDISTAVGLGYHPTRVINELNAMRSDGLVECERVGKTLTYWLTVPLDQIVTDAADAPAQSFDLPLSIKPGTRGAQVWRALRNDRALTARELEAEVNCPPGALDRLLSGFLKSGVLVRRKYPSGPGRYARPSIHRSPADSGAPQPEVGENTGRDASANLMTAEGEAVRDPQPDQPAPHSLGEPAAADETGNAGPQPADAQTAAEAAENGTAQSAATGDADVDNIVDAEIWTSPEMQYLAPEDYELPPPDLALLASANRMLSDRLDGVAHVLRGCGLPALANVRGSEDLQMYASALAGAYQMSLAELEAHKSVANEACLSLGKLADALGLPPEPGGHMPIIGKIAELQYEVGMLKSDLKKEQMAHESLQRDAMKGATLLSGQDRYTPAGYVVHVPKRRPRLLLKLERAQEAALAAAKTTGRAEVLALVRVGRAVRGSEWRSA